MSRNRTLQERGTAELEAEVRKLRRRIQDYERLHAILRTICSSLQVEEVLRLILDEAIRLCGADEGAILLFDPRETDKVQTLLHQEKNGQRILDTRLNTVLANWVSRYKKSLFTHDLRESLGARLVGDRYQQVSSVLGIPLKLRGAVLGALNLVLLGKGQEFEERELELVEILAAQCAQFIANAHLHEELFAETKRLRQEVQDRYAFAGLIVGHSPRMQQVFALLERVIPTDGRVLLEGESGTGKELVARILHYNGPRKDKPFVAVDCGALPANLLESELFGYVKGAFTGANRDKKGLFEEADGGTLFLDEIANMPLEIQSKLLRAIEASEIRPVGATRVRKVDVRIITAASDDLRARVERGEFREDLYYRLNVVRIQLPPLRERKEDIAILANHFLEKMAQKYKKNLVGFRPETVALLEQYPWPGNVRELENVVERTVILADQKQKYIEPDLLPLEVLPQGATDLPDSCGNGQPDMKTLKQNYEKTMLLEALEKHGWNQSAAARELGVTERTVRYKIQRFGLKRSDAA